MRFSDIAEKASAIRQAYPHDSIWELFDRFGIFYDMQDLSAFDRNLKGYSCCIMGKFFVVIDKKLRGKVRSVIAWHELGHIINDADELIGGRVFRDHSFDGKALLSMERNANIFAAEGAIDDEEFLELTAEGYTDRAIAAKLVVPLGFVSYKAAIMRECGYSINLAQEPDPMFLQDDIYG